MLHNAIRRRGFTLIELTVVLFIIGLTAVTVVWTLPASDDGVRAEALRFAALIRAAEDESILSGSSVGIVLTPTTYSFLTYQRGQWTPLQARDLFQPVALPDEVVIRVRREGSMLNLQSTMGRTPESINMPVLVLSPTGLNAAFAVEFQQAGESFVIARDAAGRWTLEAAYVS